MEEYKAHRKAVTYGKSSKRLPLHSIFDVNSESQQSSLTADGQQPEQEKAGPSKKRNQPDVGGHSLLGTSGGRLTASSSRALSPSSVDASPVASDSSNSQTSSNEHNESTTSSILDLPSSDEEACFRQLQPSEPKRRKVTPLSKRDASAKITNRQHRQPDSSKPLSRKPTIEGKNHMDEPFVRGKAGNRKLLARNEAVPSRPVTPTQAHENVSMGSTLEVDRTSTPSTPTPPTTPRTIRVIPRRRRRSSPSIQQREELQTVEPVNLQSPKHKKVLSTQNNDASIVPSPSKLGLSSLRLTPEKKARTRLIDKLDAPREQFQRTPESTSNTASPRKRSPSGSSPQDNTTALEAAKIPKLDEVRSKVTYAKERSHLSDMVSDLDSLALPEVPAIPGPQLHRGDSFNNIASQLDQELYESDEPGPAGAVKSIHELRQAGMNSRFERELEAMFDDIEASHSTSKSLRIQALLLLVQSLEDEEYARQFIDVGMTNRLATCGQNETDLFSGVLLSLALYSLASIDNASENSLIYMFEAIVRLLPVLLSESRNLSKIATDRKQNLSKALSRDLSEFSKTNKTWSTKNKLPLTPQNVGLCSVELMLRGLREMKDNPSHLPAPIFTQLLRVLDDACETAWDSEEHIKVTELALSSLELSAISQARKNFRGDSSIQEYQLLGDVITKAINHAKVEHPEIQCMALRLVVSLTNNQTATCDALAVTNIISAVFSIIETNLLALAETADKGDEFDSSKLDPVMMALGCLLNLADCSGEARAQLDRPLAGRSSSIDWLVFAFNLRAGKAADATTISQSQVCVAFGYLSMLLCTLCLDDGIRSHIAAKLNGHNLTKLSEEAGEFLHKLQLVATFNPDDPATSVFNQRFRTILDQVEGLIIQ